MTQQVEILKYINAAKLRDALRKIVSPQTAKRFERLSEFYVRKPYPQEVGSGNITRSVTQRTGMGGEHLVLHNGRFEALMALLEEDDYDITRLTCEIEHRPPMESPANYMLQPWYSDDALGESLEGVRLWAPSKAPKGLRLPTLALDATDDDPASLTEAVEQMEQRFVGATKTLDAVKARVTDMARCAAYWYRRFQAEQKRSNSERASGLAVVEQLVTAEEDRDAWERRAGQERDWSKTLETANRRLACERKILALGLVAMTIMAVVAVFVA